MSLRDKSTRSFSAYFYPLFFSKSWTESIVVLYGIDYIDKTMDALIKQKAFFRKEFINKRDGLSFDERMSKSSALQSRLLNLPAIRSAQTLFVYVSFRSEVSTQEIIRSALSEGKIVAVPFTDVKKRRLIPSRIFNIDDDLVPGTMGIPEPKFESIIPVGTENIDVVIAPGIAFSDVGWRLGYGGGFYDKFLMESGKKSYALGFEIQIAPFVPYDERHDMQVDFLVTEDRVISCK